MTWIENQRRFIEGLFRDKLSLWNEILKEQGYLWFDHKWKDYQEIRKTLKSNEVLQHEITEIVPKPLMMTPDGSENRVVTIETDVSSKSQTRTTRGTKRKEPIPIEDSREEAERGERTRSLRTRSSAASRSHETTITTTTIGPTKSRVRRRIKEDKISGNSIEIRAPVNSRRTSVKKRMETSPEYPSSSIPLQIGTESNISTETAEIMDVKILPGVNPAIVNIISPNDIKISGENEGHSRQTTQKDIASGVPMRRTRSKNVVPANEKPEESKSKEIPHRSRDPTSQVSANDMGLTTGKAEELSPDHIGSSAVTLQTSPAKPKPLTINNLKNALADLNARSKLRLESFSIHRSILDATHPTNSNTLIEKNANGMNDELEENLVSVGLIGPPLQSNTYYGQESPDFFEKPLRTPKPKNQGKSAKTPRRTPRSISRNGKLLSSKKKITRESQRPEVLWQDYTIDVPLTSPLATTQPKIRSPDRHLRTPAMLAKLKMKRTPKSDIILSPLKTITPLSTMSTGTENPTLMMDVGKKEPETSDTQYPISMLPGMSERGNMESHMTENRNSNLTSRISPPVRQTMNSRLLRRRYVLIMPGNPSNLFPIRNSGESRYREISPYRSRRASKIHQRSFSRYKEPSYARTTVSYSSETHELEESRDPQK
jgi:hypothetical protein